MQFDTLIVGQLSLDRNTDYDGRLEQNVGGAAIYSSYAASALGYHMAALTKGNPAQVDPYAAFSGAENVEVFQIDTESTTSISNIYLSADRERRDCSVLSRIPSYVPEDIPDLDASIYQIAVLMNGDCDEEVISHVAERGKVVLDVQGFLRHVADDMNMYFGVWDR